MAALRWPQSATVRMLYDGGCPLCEREVDFLRSRNTEGRIDFVDIDSDEFDASWNRGIGFEQAMASIHAIRADGSVISGVPVFRELLYFSSKIFLTSFRAVCLACGLFVLATSAVTTDLSSTSRA